MQVGFTIYLILKVLLTFPFKFWNKVGNTTKISKTFTIDMTRVVFLRFYRICDLGRVSCVKSSLVWLLRYQKDNKDKQMARHATEFYEHNRCDFENSERYLWVLDATDKCGTVCHGMSKSLLLIVSTEIMKVKIFYLENMGAERFERDNDWCYARGKIHTEFTWNMTVRSSQEAWFDICWDTCSINFVTINRSNLENELYRNELYRCMLSKTETDHYTVTLNMY